MKIAVFGLGYVGLSNAVLLAQHHEVVISNRRTDDLDDVAGKVLTRDLFGSD